MSIASRKAVLTAAADVLDERGYRGFSVDEVARRSRVSKATIYKHWSGGFEIAVEGYGQRVTEALPVASTGHVEADLLEQVRRVADLYAGPRGRVITELLGAGAAIPNGAGLVRDRFFAQRRADSSALVHQGVAAGLWRLDFEPELVIELLFGPVVFRAVNGERPLSAEEATSLASVALRGLRRDVAG